MAKRKITINVRSGRNVRRRLTYDTKPRTTRRKRRGGAARVQSWTMQTAQGKGLRPMTRKLSARAWRSQLWRETLTKTHWKSAGNTVTSFSTGTTPGAGTVFTLYPTFIGTAGNPANAFWTTTGGLQPKDTGATAPTFAEGNLVIRGGQVGMNFSVLDAVTAETSIRIWTVWTIPTPVTSAVPATISYGSQLTTGPDFESKFGKVIDYKEAILNGDYPSFTYVRRMKVQKIDMETHGTLLGRQLAFVVAVSNLQAADDVTVQALVWHDMSFSGDVENVV